MLQPGGSQATAAEGPGLEDMGIRVRGEVAWSCGWRENREGFGGLGFRA